MPVFELLVHSGIVVCVLCVLFWRDLTLDFFVFACLAVVWAPHRHTRMYAGHWKRNFGACICASRVQWHRSMCLVCIILTRSDFGFFCVCVVWAPHIHTRMYQGHWKRYFGAYVWASRAEWHCSMCIVCIIWTRFDFGFLCVCVLSTPHIQTSVYWGHCKRYFGACICASRAQWHRSMRIVCIILTRSDFWCLHVCVPSCSLTATYTYTHVYRALKEELWCLYLSFSCTVAS